MDNAQLTLALQILLSQNNLVEESKEAYDQIKQIFSQPISVRIEGDTHFGKALAAIRHFSQAVEKLSRGVEKLRADISEPLDDSGLEDTADAAEKAAQEIDRLNARLEKYVERRKRLEERLVEKGFVTHEKVKDFPWLDEYYERMHQAYQRYGERIEQLQERIRKSQERLAARQAKTAAQSAKGAATAVAGAAGPSVTASVNVQISASELIEQIRAALNSTEFQIRINQSDLARQIGASFKKINYASLTEGLKGATEGISKSLHDAMAPLTSFDPNQFVAAIQKAVVDANKRTDARLKFSLHRTHLRDEIREVARDEKGLLPKLRIGISQPHFISSVYAAVEAAQKSIEENMAEGKIKIGLHMTHLRDQINHVLRNENNRLARLRVGINQPYFISSLYEAIEAAEKANLKVNVTATVEALSREAREMALLAAQSAEQARKAADSIDIDAKRAASRERRLRERDLERKGVISRELAAQYAKTDPIGFLRRNAPHLVPMAEKLVAWTRPGLTDEQRKQAILEAKAVKDDFKRLIAEFEWSATDRAVKENMLRFGRAFRALYITELDKKERQHTGRLASAAQKMILDDLLRAQYLRHIAQKDQELRTFAAYRPDFMGEFRNQFEEQQRAYQRRLNELRKWEREMLGYTTARTEKEREIAHRRVKSAQQSLELTEREYKYRLLETRGNIAAPHVSLSPDGRAAIVGGTVELSKAETAVRFDELLRREFGAAFQQIQQTFDAERRRLIAQGDARAALRLPELTFSGFLDRVRAGDRATLDIYLKTKGISNKILRDEQKREAAIRRLLDPLREVLRIEEQLTREAREQHRLQDAIFRYRQARAHRAANPSEFARTIRGVSYLIGGYAVGMAVAFQVRDALRTMMQFEQITRDIQGILSSKSLYDAQRIAAGVASSARRYGADLIETAQAAKILAQTGMDASTVIRELDYTMLAMRGMGVTIEQMQELQVAVRAMADESERAIATVSALERISEIESAYAVTAQDLATAIQLLSPVMKQFEHDVSGIAGAMDYTIALTTVMVEKLRVTGSQAANAVKFMLSRIVRPEILKSLQEDFGLRIATPDGRDFLPLPDLLAEIARRYMELASNPKTAGQAKQFAVQLAGGRQYNLIVAALQDFARVQEIATRSSFAFGSAQQRAQIAVDTLAVKLARLRVNFQLFTKNVMESSEVTEGLKFMVEGLADLLGGISGQGGGLLTSLFLVGGIGAAAKGTKAAWRLLDAASLVGGDAWAVLRAERAERAAQRRTGVITHQTSRLARAGNAAVNVFGRLASIFSAPGVLIGGLLLGISVIGKLSKAFSDGSEEVDKYRVRLRSLADMRVFESPQFQRFDRMAQEYGLGTAAVAYRQIESIIAGQGSNVQALLRQRGLIDEALPRHLQIQQVADNLLRPENIAFLRSFRREFVDAFVKDLPDAAGKIREINSEAERVAVVTQLIGHAAWAASFQIEQALTAMRENTNRLLSDVLTGLDSFDKEQRKGWLHRGWGALVDAVTGRVTMQTALQLKPSFETTGLGDVVAIPAATGQQAAQLARKLLIESGMSQQLADAVASVDSLVAAFNELNDGARQTLTVTELLNKHFERLRQTTGEFVTEFGTKVGSEYERVVAQVANVMLRQSGIPELRLAAAVEGAGGKSPSEVFRDNIQKLFADAQNVAIEQARKVLGENHPALESLRAVYELLNRATESAKFNLDDLSDAAFKLKDRLLDMIFAIEEGMARIRAEQAVATRFGFRFEPGEEMIQLGRQLLMDLAALPLQIEFDILRAQNQVERLSPSEQLRRQLAGADRAAAVAILEEMDVDALLPGGQEDERVKRLEAEIKAWRENRTLLSQTAKQIENLFPDTPEGLEALERFRRAWAEAFAQDDRLTMAELLRDIAEQIIRMGRDMAFSSARAVQQLEIQQQIHERMADLRRRALDDETSLARRIVERNAIEEQLLAVQVAILRRRMELGNLDRNEGQLQIERLRIERQINEVFERRSELLNANLELDRQIRDNIANSMAGIAAVLKDLSIWQRAGEDIAVALLTPIGQAFHERVVENLTGALIEAAQQNEMLRELFATPEIRLQRNIETAATYAHDRFYDAIFSSSRVGSELFYQAIHRAVIETGLVSGAGGTGTAAGVTALAAGTVAVVRRRSAPDENGIVLDIPEPQLQPGFMEVPAVPVANEARLRNLGQSLMLMAGTLGGTLLGNAMGGSYGSLGASLGTLLGQALIPIPGLGGMLGGLFGGFVGGLFGKEKKQQHEVVRTLQAIERAQKETIATIKAQTDALLSPGNRLFNLPSTFNIPAYRPNLAGAGFSTVVNNNQTINITVNTSGMSEPEARRMVEAAVADALYAGRRNRGKSVSNI